MKFQVVLVELLLENHMRDIYVLIIELCTQIKKNTSPAPILVSILGIYLWKQPRMMN